MEELTDKRPLDDPFSLVKTNYCYSFKVTKQTTVLNILWNA